MSKSSSDARAERMRTKVAARYVADRLSYKDLTAEDRAVVCNGCGGKGGFVRPPQFKFKASCDHHDFAYWRGGGERDRRRADRKFLLAMIEDAFEADGWDQFAHICAAIAFYVAVRRHGKKFFHYGNQRGRVDLAAALSVTNFRAS